MDHRESAAALRSSVQRMFDDGPDPQEVPRRESGATERIIAWQPTTERELSIFTRSNTKRFNASVEPLSAIAAYGEGERVIPKSETLLSFDPNDLNPSRSASQVRRPSTVLLPDDAPKRFGARSPMPMLMEGGSDEGAIERDIAPTRISKVSHVIFPKPTVGGQPMMIPGDLPMIPSVTSSSVETRESTSGRTPQTDESSVTSVSSANPTVLAKLETHSTEHGTIARQIDGVQVDIRRIISSLGALVRQSKTVPAPLESEMIPKALDEKITSLQLDVQGIGNALQLSSLATSRQAPLAPPEEPNLLDVHSKLDNIAKLCENLLSKQALAVPASDPATIDGLPLRASRVGEAPKTPAPPGSLGLSVKPSEEKIAGEEVAQIMADLVSLQGCRYQSMLMGSLIDWWFDKGFTEAWRHTYAQCLSSVQS